MRRLMDSAWLSRHPHIGSSPGNGVALREAPRVEQLRAGRAETAAKARALAFADANDRWTVAFDAPLANSRDVDILLSGRERLHCCERTVITESDEDQQVLDEWLEARKTTPGLLLAPPGPFDSANAKGPSPYQDTSRFYTNVFDKLQKAGNPAQCQTSPDCPNVLLLSCFPGHSAPLTSGVLLVEACSSLPGGPPVGRGRSRPAPRMSSIRCAWNQREQLLPDLAPLIRCHSEPRERARQRPGPPAICSIG
jgi:hypothetical protein